MNVFNHIYTNGCSFMWGHGHNHPPTFKHFEETKDIDISNWKPTSYYQFFNEFDWVREAFNFPALIGREFNCKVTNEAIFGGSLDRVVRKTYDWIINNTALAQETLFILEWPIGIRGELYSLYHSRYVNYTSGLDNFDNVDEDVWKNVMNYYQHFVDEEKKDKNDLYMFIGLLSFLKNNNLQYLIIVDEGYDKIEKLHIKAIDELIKPHLVNFEDWDNKFSLVGFYFNHHIATFSNDTNKEFDDNHNSFRGSKLIAEKIIKNIKESYEIN